MGLDLDRAVPALSQGESSIARLPKRPRSRVYQTLATLAFRILLAALSSVVLVALAFSALFLTAAPKLISTLFEPLSLLLLPGLLVAMLAAGLHDYSPYVALQGSLVLYFILFYAMLRWRSRWRRRR